MLDWALLAHLLQLKARSADMPAELQPAPPLLHPERQMPAPDSCVAGWQGLVWRKALLAALVQRGPLLAALPQPTARVLDPPAGPQPALLLPEHWMAEPACHASSAGRFNA